MQAEADESVGSARHAGRAEGEAFVAALRAAEERAIEQRLTLLTQDPPDDRPLADDSVAAPTELARLRSQVEALAAFRAAVLSSSAWRAIQSVRRIFGRAW